MNEKKLTQKEIMFCENYITCGNATQAAIKAGYKGKSVRMTACEKLTKPNIQEYINSLRKESKNKAILTYNDKRRLLSNIILNENFKILERLKALDILNKMDGAYTNKVEVMGEIKTNLFKELTTEELKKIIDKL